VTLILTLTLCLLAAAAACADDDEEATASPTSVVTGTATVTPSPGPVTSPATASPTPTASITNVCGTNPDPATPQEAVITAPVAGAQVSSPLMVSGTIAAFEAVFHISIKDAQLNDIASQPGMSSEGQTLAPFGESVPFTVTAPTAACVWVFQFSAMDGTTPINVTQIPVTLAP
jgi:hypothetical protein